MSLRVTCPGCQTSFELQEQLRGKKVRCKKCAKVFVAEEKSADEAEELAEVEPIDEAEEKQAIQSQKRSVPPRKAPAAAAKPAGKAKRRHDDDDEDDEDRPARKRKKSNAGLVIALVAGGAGLMFLLVCGGAAAYFLMARSSARVASPTPSTVAVNPPFNNPPPAPPPQEAPFNPGFNNPPANNNPGNNNNLPQVVVPPPRNDQQPAQAPPEKVAWAVDVDPSPDPAKAAENVKTTVPIPGGANVLFARGPFVAVGRNSGQKDSRDIWDLRTMKRVGTLRGKIDVGDPQVLSRNGAFFAGKPSFAAAVEVWSCAEGKQVRRLEVDPKPVHLDYVDFAGTNIVTIKNTGEGKIVQFWDVLKGNTISEFNMGRSLDSKSETTSPGGKYLAFTAEHKLQVYDLAKGTCVGEMKLPKEGIFQLHGKALAFSPDGAELVGIFEGGSKSRIISWDVAKGDVSADHVFQKDLKSAAPRANIYQGPALEWLTDRSGWFLYGHLIVDHKSGGLVWTIPSADAGFPGMRHVVDQDHVAIESGNFNAKKLEIVTLPKDQIAAAVKAARAGQDPATAALPAPKQADWSAVRVVPAAGNVPWNVDVDAPAPKKPLTRQPIPLRGKGAEIERVVFSGPQTAQAVIVSAAAPNELSVIKQIRAERFDLTDGKSYGVVDLFSSPLEHRANLNADLSVDAKAIATREPNAGKRIDIWSAADGKHIVGFSPYEREDPNSAGVSWFTLLDESKLVTVSTTGKLALWSLPECKAVYSIDNLRGGLALSPGRKYLAYFTGASYEVLDTAGGERKGQFAQPPGYNLAGAHAGAFRPDGAEFAAVTRSAEGHVLLSRWDTKKGTPADSFPVGMIFQELEWAGTQHVLLDSTLYDLGRKVPIWRYSLPGTGKHGQGSPDGRHWYAVGRTNDQPAFLTAQTLPDDNAKRMAALVANPATQTLFKPGSAVNIQLDIKGTPPKPDELRNQINAGLTNRFRSLGYKVEPGGATLTIQVQETDTGKKREYREIGGFRAKGGVLTVNVKLLTMTASLTDAQGTSFWQHKGTFETPDAFGIVRTDNPETYFHERLWSNFQGWATNMPAPAFVIKQGATIEILPKDAPLTGDR